MKKGELFAFLGVNGAEKYSHFYSLWTAEKDDGTVQVNGMKQQSQRTDKKDAWCCISG